MRLLCVVLAVVWGLSAATGLTTISQTIKNPDGTLFQGTVHIALNAACTLADGTRVYPSPKSISVTNGVFSVQLYPNSSCTPTGTSYRVTYQSRGVAAREETWVVGTTTPTAIEDVAVDTVPLLGPTARTYTATAGALASDPADCVDGYYAVAISATGNLTCAQITAIRTATTAPATCSIGHVWFDSDASAGQNIYGCTATNTWTLQGAPTANVLTQAAEFTAAGQLARAATDSGRAVEPSTCKEVDGVFSCGNGTSPGSIELLIPEEDLAAPSESLVALGPDADGDWAVRGYGDETSTKLATATDLSLLTTAQTANYGLMGPTSGAAAVPTFRALVAGDIPSLAAVSETLTNKTIDAEGTGNVITLTSKAWLEAAGCQNTTAGLMWDTPTTNPAVAACVTGTNTQKGVAAFADGASLSMQRTLALPADWTGAIDARFKWSTSGTSGSVVWQISTSCVADAETDDPSWNTASTVTDAAKGTANQTNDASITGVTTTGCAAGELLHIKVLRDAAHASDDLAATANLIGVELTIRRTM